MDEKVLDRIKTSSVLTPELKEYFLDILDTFTEEEKENLLVVLDESEQEFELINKKAKDQERLINKEYSEKINQIAKQGIKKAVEKEEGEEEKEAEKILDNL